MHCIWFTVCLNISERDRQWRWCVVLECCELQTLTVVAQVEKPASDCDTELAVADVHVASCTDFPEESESVSAIKESKESLEISLSELQQVLPELPPKQPQVPPRPALSRSRPTGSQSFSAAPPRPPAMQPRLIHRAQSSAASVLPPVPPRAPRTVTTIHNTQSTLFSLQQPTATAVVSSNVVVPHLAPLLSHTSPDTSTSGTTFNYVYFTEEAVPPATELPATKSKKQKQPPDIGLFGGRHATIGKKLADSGFGAVNPPISDSYDTNPAGSYVRLAMTSSPRAVDPVTSHDYCYPSIDAVVPAPTVSICQIEPQHSPPPLPTKSRRVGLWNCRWWDCRLRRQQRHSSQFRATWSQRASTYGTEPSVAASHVSLNNSQSSSLNTRRPPAAWRSRLLCFVRTCMHPCRWRRHCRPIRRLRQSRGHEAVIGRL